MTLWPSILKAVIEVESAIQAPGATKKAIVLSAITAAAGVAGQSGNTSAAVIGGMIDTTVTSLKAAGVFGASPTTVTAIGVAPVVPAPAALAAAA